MIINVVVVVIALMFGVFIFRGEVQGGRTKVSATLYPWVSIPIIGSVMIVLAHIMKWPDLATLAVKALAYSAIAGVLLIGLYFLCIWGSVMLFRCLAAECSIPGRPWR